MYSFPTETYTVFSVCFIASECIYRTGKKHETIVNRKLKPKQLSTDKAQTCDVVMVTVMWFSVP